jgi:hypothetical protein
MERLRDAAEQYVRVFWPVRFDVSPIEHLQFGAKLHTLILGVSPILSIPDAICDEIARFLRKCGQKPQQRIRGFTRISLN